ncbi:MAG: nucleoside triphosphate pyrophosphohydrolase [Desulfobulbaceae bacterium]|nr:nucleoside triphosphate pyrophosphohydrolase [Desulfobulbaceae bacterium]
MRKFNELLDIVARLRAPDGCPWDQKQTPQSFKPYIIEEANELAEAIDHDDPDHVREELGDLLFQVAFLNRLYEEQGLFTMEEVVSTIIDKMIRRHPHVFGNTRVTSEEALRRQWTAIKATEKAGKDKGGNTLVALPRSLPALKRAQRVSESAAQAGFEWPDQESVFAKLEEEIGECRQAVAARDKEAIFEEIGDILFVMVNIGRSTGINTEEALQAAIDKFTGRFRELELQVSHSGRAMADLGSDVLLALWRRAKEKGLSGANSPDKKRG